MPGAIEQILDNILDNALAVSPAGSEISVTVDAGTTAHRLVTVDHGPGLSQGNKERARRRFWRGTSASAGSGSGSGLAIADALAAASGGRIELSDTPESGLTVTVTFPPGLPATGEPHPVEAARR